MSDHTSQGKAKAPAGEMVPDLSQEIERAVAREPQDQVRCRRVFGDYYRCNWWAPLAADDWVHADPAVYWGVATTHHVRKSRFLNATVNVGQLVIQEVKYRTR